MGRPVLSNQSRTLNYFSDRCYEYQTIQHNIGTIDYSNKNDHDLGHDIKNFVCPEQETQLPTKVLLKSDTRQNSDSAKGVVEDEIQGLLQRGSFDTIGERKVPSDADVLGGRFIIEISQTGSTSEQH